MVVEIFWVEVGGVTGDTSAHREDTNVEYHTVKVIEQKVDTKQKNILISIRCILQSYPNTKCRNSRVPKKM